MTATKLIADAVRWSRGPVDFCDTLRCMIAAMSGKKVHRHDAWERRLGRNYKLRDVPGAEGAYFILSKEDNYGRKVRNGNDAPRGGVCGEYYTMRKDGRRAGIIEKLRAIYARATQDQIFLSSRGKKFKDAASALIDNLSEIC